MYIFFKVYSNEINYVKIFFFWVKAIGFNINSIKTQLNNKRLSHLKDSLWMFLFKWFCIITSLVSNKNLSFVYNLFFRRKICNDNYLFIITNMNLQIYMQKKEKRMKKESIKWMNSFMGTINPIISAIMLRFYISLLKTGLMSESWQRYFFQSK